jgi:hypothetical protein
MDCLLMDGGRCLCCSAIIGITFLIIGSIVAVWTPSILCQQSLNTPHTWDTTGWFIHLDVGSPVECGFVGICYAGYGDLVYNETRWQNATTFPDGEIKLCQQGRELVRPRTDRQWIHDQVQKFAIVYPGLWRNAEGRCLLEECKQRCPDWTFFGGIFPMLAIFSFGIYFWLRCSSRNVRV